MNHRDKDLSLQLLLNLVVAVAAVHYCVDYSIQVVIFFHVLVWRSNGSELGQR